MNKRSVHLRCLRAAASLIVFGALICSVISCGKKETGFVTYESEETRQTTLTFFGNINAASKMIPVEELITAYMKEHPDVNIIYEGIDPSLKVDYTMLLSKRLSAGKGDDIFFSYAGYLPTLVEGDYLEQLDALESWSAYAEEEKEFLLLDDHYYGIPMERTVIGLYCNLDVLEKFDLPVPETFDQFLEDCSTLKENGLTPVASSQLIPFSGYAYADGLAKIYRSENGQTQIRPGNGNESFGIYFQEGFENLSKLLDFGYIDRNTTLSHDTTEQAEKDFASGQSAFLLGASDLNASILEENAELNYAVYPIPVSSGEGVVLSAPDHLLCVNAKSPNKEIALDFVEFCTQRSRIESYVKKQGLLSPLEGSEMEAKSLAPVAQIISEGKAIPSVDYQWIARLQNWIQQSGLKMLQGASPDEAIQDLDAMIEKIRE
ncbi:MAG: extracellular solute-binding protein [Lachnospiraceae bacterium]|nr:extracellular solute-binding protein [Lachnospiraceae bacterium]